MHPSEMTDEAPTPGINDILTDLVEYAIDRVYEQLEDPEPSARISGYTVTAIANAAKQIKEQQQERVEKMDDLVKHAEFVIERLGPIARGLISETKAYISKDDAGRQIRALSEGLWMKTTVAEAALKELETEGD